MEYITGLSLNFEELLISQAGALGGAPLAGMSPATGAVFLLAGAAMALMLLAAILDKPYRSWANWVGGLGELLRFLRQSKHTACNAGPMRALPASNRRPARLSRA